MKSKQNSKSQTAKVSKKPCPDLTKHNNEILSQIPMPISQNMTTLCLLNNNIVSLSNILHYPSLQTLDISNNNLCNINELKHLSQCKQLKHINIQGNPINDIVNILYYVACSVGHPLQINTLIIDNDMKELIKRQQYNGSRIVQFMLQACSIFEIILKCQHQYSLQQIHQQLMTCRQVMNKTSTTPGQQYKKFNNFIYDSFPLKSVDIPAHSLDQIKQIKSYYIEKLTQTDNQQPNDFVYKVLSQIEVADDSQQKQLQQKVEVTKLIIHDKICKEYSLTQQFTRNFINQSSSKNKNQLKHFTSADTAPETYDGERSCDQQIGLHFCLDAEYIKVANKVIHAEIDRLLFVVDQEIKKTSTQQNEDSLQQQNLKSPIYDLTSRQTFRITQIQQTEQFQLQSAKKMYNNASILSNLLQVLEISIKKIIFKKIKKHISGRVIQLFSQKLNKGLQKHLNSLLKYANDKLISDQMKQIQTCNKLKTQKLRKIFTCWKNIKKLRTKLLKNIIKRKSKVDTFISAVAFTKWKMNSRTDRIRRMASAAVLSTKISSLPKSNKGIQLAYQRVSTLKKLRIH